MEVAEKLIVFCLLLSTNYKKGLSHWIMAVVLGLGSVFITTPINISGVISSLCVVATFLTSKTLYGKYNQRMDLFNAKTSMEFFNDLKWILIIILLFLAIKLIGAYASGKSIQFKFHLSMLGRALGAGISEEIIFRLFLFSVLVSICKEREVSKFLAVMVMSIPFALFHCVEIGVNNSIFR